MESTPTATPAPTWQSLQVLAMSLVGAPVVILVAIWFVLGSDDPWSPPTVMLAVPVVLALGAAAMIQAVGYRTPALPATTPSQEAGETGARRFQSLMMIRFVLSELVTILPLALAFVVPHGGFSVLLIGVILSEALMLTHVLPNDTQVEKVRRSLASQGAVVPLREALRNA